MHIVLETPGGTGLYLSFNVFGWIIATILISLALWQVTIKKALITSFLQLYSLMGFICLCIPMFYGSEFSDHAIPRLLGLAGGLLILFSLYQFDELKQNPQQLLWWILFAIAIQACFGLIQYFFLQPDDWAGYKPSVNRPHGSFLQPNVMASFMATGIAISLYLSINVKRSAIGKYQNLFCYFCLFFTTFLVVILQSRTGHLASIAIITFISPFLFLKNRKRLTSNLLVISIAVITALVSFNNSSTFSRGEENYQKAGSRPDTYIITTQMIINKPLLGAGYGHYQRDFLDTYNNYVLNNPQFGNAQQRMGHPHNEVLYWVSEGGVAALLGMIFFFIAYMNSWLKISTKLAKRLAILGLITPLLLHSQLEFPFYSSVSHWFIFIVLLWYTDTYSESKKIQYALNNTFLLRFIAILLPVIFVPFLVTTLHTANIIVEHEKHRYQNVERLLDIVNPIAWQDRLDVHIYARTLVMGLREKNPKAIQRYINWGLKRVRYAPRRSVYSNILLCLNILQQNEEYQRVLKEAQQTYPLVKEWGRNIVHEEKTN